MHTNFSKQNEELKCNNAVQCVLMTHSELVTRECDAIKNKFNSIKIINEAYISPGSNFLLNNFLPVCISAK